MSDQIAVPFLVPASRRTARPTAGAELLARCAAWLRWISDDSCPHGMEPRLARDIGATPAGDGRPEGFAADPRPLWGIGLTPQPTETDPPWRRRG
ncbi:MAG: hypothetical protein QJR07_00930 [Acetobacteraceae bacterium]|nr:hypothetical protein [Acetobacteraceae bacterium]